MKKVGIMGGTFNPIHQAHVLLAKQAYEALGLDYVLVMPLKTPQFKSANELVSDEDRINMIKASIEDAPYLRFSDFELNREGKTYTSETVKLLHENYPDTRFYFIVGGDSLDYFENWHEPEVILENCALCCTGRADYDNTKAAATIRRLTDKFGSYEETRELPEIINLKTASMNISSSDIRKRVACSLPIAGLVNEKVREYIYSHNLYKSQLIEEIKSDMKAALKESRYVHTLGVAETAAYIAFSNDYDPEEAYITGLLHDCAKCLSDEEILTLADKYGYKPDSFEKKYVNNLLHSKIGAYMAREKYGIGDASFNAIFYHTTGRRNMSVLEKIIFISDTVEPNRKMIYQPGLGLIRNTATADIDRACLMIMDNNIPYLLETYSDSLSPESLDAYRYICEINNVKRS